jgi:hypothetical protein
MTPNNTTITIRPRQEEILDATNHAAASVLTLHLIGRPADEAIIINGESIIFNRRRLKGEGRIGNKIFSSKLNRQCTSCALLVCTITYQRGVWLRSYFVVWTQTGEAQKFSIQV